jgi:hypothetical protein
MLPACLSLSSVRFAWRWKFVRIHDLDSCPQGLSFDNEGRKPVRDPAPARLIKMSRRGGGETTREERG